MIKIIEAHRKIFCSEYIVSTLIFLVESDLQCSRCTVRFFDKVHGFQFLLTRRRALRQVLSPALLEFPDDVFLPADLILLLVIRP